MAEFWRPWSDGGTNRSIKSPCESEPAVCAIDALPLKPIDSKIDELLTGEPIIIGQDELRSIQIHA